MNPFIFVLGILALTIVVPLWIVFHYLTRWRAQRGLTTEDERMLADLWESAKRMENRIVNLERIVKEGADGRPKEGP
jgi:phage shock protein B